MQQLHGPFALPDLLWALGAFFFFFKARSHFCFLYPQWPLHLEQGGVDVCVSRSRVPREAKRSETPDTRPGLQGSPGKRQPRAQALGRRGPSRLSGRGQVGAARARSRAHGRRGGAVARGCGLVPAEVAPAASQATDGRRARDSGARPTPAHVGLIRGSRTSTSGTAINALRTLPFPRCVLLPQTSLDFVTELGECFGACNFFFVN